MASDPYRGPHAVFTDEELKHIYQRIREVQEGLFKPLQMSILSKIERALGSDPKWRQPPP